MLELERQGLDLAIASMHKPDEGMFHESVCRVRAKADYLHDRLFDAPGKIIRAHASFFRECPRGYGCAVRDVLAHAGAEWRDLMQAALLLRWAKKRGIRHVHVHFGTCEATVALLAHRIGGLSYSLTLHAFDIFRENVDRPLLVQKINASRFTVTVSEFNRRYIIENFPGVDASRIRVNYNGVDLERFHPGRAARDPYLVFGVGRLIEKKGFGHLVKAVARLRDAGIPVRCCIAGDGPDEPALKRAIKDRGLRGMVELLGPLRQDAVLDFMQRAACFVLPCVQAKDGNMDALPTVLLESMAAECPTISTRVSGVPEIIENDVSGLLVPPGDDAALADAMRRVLMDPTLTARLATGGRRRAEERFDVRKNVTVMREWLRQAASSTPIVAATDGQRVGTAGAPPVLAEAR